MTLRVHLMLALGHKKLDAIKREDVQRLKSGLVVKAVKTVNNILTVLNVLLKKAVEWEVVDRMSRTIALLPVPKTSMASTISTSANTSSSRRTRSTGQCRSSYRPQKTQDFAAAR